MITVSPYTDKANRFRIGNTYHFKMQGAGNEKEKCGSLPGKDGKRLPHAHYKKEMLMNSIQKRMT